MVVYWSKVRACRIVGRFENADDARELEAALCSQPGILETMRASLKARLLVEERYSPEEAFRILNDTVARLKTVDEVARVGFQTQKHRTTCPPIISVDLRPILIA